MKKILLASVLLLPSPALAEDISPVGCFGFLKKGKNPESMRLAFRLDMRLSGRVLSATGTCDDPREKEEKRP